MKRSLLLSIFLVAAMNYAVADIQYNIRVDGITCPFCVATSAKALKKIDGVKRVKADLENGIIKVCANDSLEFSDSQLSTLFIEKGFTYRSKEKQAQCDSS
ncbi:MAG: heavy metal transport/detoxification protein [Alteromonadaceae bacterium]|nr:MAG: heavy metal transport/detoxification protein [Alteromonadaceae bacterium]